MTDVVILNNYDDIDRVRNEERGGKRSGQIQRCLMLQVRTPRAVRTERLTPSSQPLHRLVLFYFCAVASTTHILQLYIGPLFVTFTVNSCPFNISKYV